MHARGTRHGRDTGRQARGRYTRAVQGARGVPRRGPGGAREGSKGENRRRGVAAEVGAGGGGGDETRQPRAPPGRLAVAATDRVPDRRAVRPEPVVGERRRGYPDHARRPRRRDFQPRRLQRRSSPGQHTPDARRSTGTDRLRSGEAREQGREGGVRQAHAGDISRGQGRGGEVAEVRAPRGVRRREPRQRRRRRVQTVRLLERQGHPGRHRRSEPAGVHR